jgi:hypothetical protein
MFQVVTSTSTQTHVEPYTKPTTVINHPENEDMFIDVKVIQNTEAKEFIFQGLWVDGGRGR